MRMLLYFATLLFLEAPAAPLDIVLIPHSHCDAGYRMTFTGYYKAEVRHIISTVVTELNNDPKKRFVWEEVSYFELWWNEQTNATQAIVRKLIANQQLEFIGGGWVMHDEADGTVAQEINQMAKGLEWLASTLGVRPHIQWQVDPFGHSSTTSTIHAMLGFDVLVLNRLPHETKVALKKHHQMEFLWKPSQHSNLPDKKASIFVHVLDSHYSSPNLPKGTVQERAQVLAETGRVRAAYYRTPQVLIPFGNDFEFQDAKKVFGEMDPLVEYINTHRSEFPDVTVRYATLTEYFVSLRARNTTFPVLTNTDFFPYIACSCDDAVCKNYSGAPCGDEDSYWSGYFTSKPAQKLLSSVQDASLRAAEALFLFARTATAPLQQWWNGLQNARYQSALYQHHDAITGTSFSACTHSITECDCYKDYTERMDHALSTTDDMVTEMAQIVLAKPNVTATVPELSQSYASNFATMVKTNGTMAIVAYNTLNWARGDVLAVGPMDGEPLVKPECVKVLSSSNTVLLSQLVFDAIRNATTLYIAAPNNTSPAMSLSTVFASLTCTTPFTLPAYKMNLHTFYQNDAAFSLDNNQIKLTFIDGHVKAHTDRTGAVHTYEVDYIKYTERLPRNLNIFTGSNVYTFTPMSNTSMLGEVVDTTITAMGPLVWMATITTTHVAHSYALFAGDTTIYNQVRIGGLPKQGATTIALRVSTDVETTSRAFTTLTNAYTAAVRVYDDAKPVQGNVYPTPSGLYLTPTSGKGPQVGMAFSRSVGVTGGRGRMEAILHRQIIDGDTRGWEFDTIDEWIAVSLTPSPEPLLPLALRGANPLIIRVAVVKNQLQWSSQMNPTFHLIPSDQQLLSSEVHLLDLKALTADATRVGARLQKLPGSNTAVKVSFSQLFPKLGVVSAVESSLDYLLPVEQIKRWEWVKDKTQQVQKQEQEQDEEEPFHTSQIEHNSGDADTVVVAVPYDIVAAVLTRK